MTAVGSVVESKAPSVWFWDGDDISRYRRVAWRITLPPSPPTIRVRGGVVDPGEVAGGRTFRLDVGHFLLQGGFDTS